jgi:WD40 repeat protein
VGTLASHEKSVMSVSFGADGRCMVSGGGHSLIRVWGTESKDCRLILSGDAEGVFDAVFHSDGFDISVSDRIRLRESSWLRRSMKPTQIGEIAIDLCRVHLYDLLKQNRQAAGMGFPAGLVSAYGGTPR